MFKLFLDKTVNFVSSPTSKNTRSNVVNVRQLAKQSKARKAKQSCKKRMKAEYEIIKLKIDKIRTVNETPIPCPVKQLL